MRYALQAMLIVLGLASSLGGYADEYRALLARYQAALEHEDEQALSAMITADATIEIHLQQAKEDDLRLTLSRDEFVQHLRALWRFSESQSYQQKNIRWHDSAQGASVRLEQTESYQLFGERLVQQSDVALQISVVGNATQITSIKTITQQW
jgi:hypothetical protein